MKPFYAMKTKDDIVELYIYGDITSDKWFDSDVTADEFVKQIEEITAKEIIVYINSYGGEVSQGIAIYNALKRHEATVTTVCDGFACSIASVIFMAGDVRKMHKSSLLMIHNAWTVAQGNAEELEKQAEDLRVINEAVKSAYADKINISEDELVKLLDAESWLAPTDALSMGFATEIVDEEETTKASASAGKKVFDALTKKEEETENELEKTLDKLMEKLNEIAEILNEEPKEKELEEEKEEKADNAMDKFINIFTK